MDCVCQRCHKECSTRTCPDHCYCCWKSPNPNHLWDHGFMDVVKTPIVSQSVNQKKKNLEWFTNSRRITLKTIKTHHNQSKRPVTMLNAQMNTALLRRCSYTIEYNAKMRFSSIWDQDLQGVNSGLICMKICGTKGRWVNSLAPGYLTENSNG